MSQYPTAVPSFATILDGVDYPQAAHINDRQAEIVAIADALKNGIAHPVSLTSTNGLTVGGSLNVSGASTLATLSVTGGSTFAGPVVFSSGVTVSQALTLSSGATVSTGVIRQNSLPMWNVYRSTHVAMASGSSNGINFDVQDFVRGSVEHSTTTNSSRVTINTTGVYHVSASAFVEATAGNPPVKLHVRLNDATDLITGVVTPLAAAGKFELVSVSHDVRMASSGYLTCVLVSSGAASTAGSSAASRAIRFSGHFLG